MPVDYDYDCGYLQIQYDCGQPLVEAGGVANERRIGLHAAGAILSFWFRWLRSENLWSGMKPVLSKFTQKVRDQIECEAKQAVKQTVSRRDQAGALLSGGCAAVAGGVDERRVQARAEVLLHSGPYPPDKSQPADGSVRD